MPSIDTGNTAIEDPSGDHLPKRSTTETIKNLEESLTKHKKLPPYDREGDDGQSRLAHKTPGSEVQEIKNKGIPSWKKYPGG